MVFVDKRGKVIFTDSLGNLFFDKYNNRYTCDYDFSKCNTLVLSGGALKCLYMLGALTRINKKFTVYIGTSAGAAVCTLLAIGYTPFEIFKRITKHSDYAIRGVLDLVTSEMSQMFRDKNVDPEITLNEFEKLTKCTFGFIASNMSKFREELIINKYHATTPILKAVRMSSAIPVVFPLEKYNGQIFWDGLLFDNFPIKLALVLENVENVVAITTHQSRYDPRIKNFYKMTNKFKIVMVPADLGFSFDVSVTEKFDMFMIGYKFVSDQLTRRKHRRNSI